jgi:hypothetical protein
MLYNVIRCNFVKQKLRVWCKANYMNKAFMKPEVLLPRLYEAATGLN